jgi:Fe-S-cluster containining protein
MVLIAEDEARVIRDLVEAMPEPRRSTIKNRFTEAARRITEAGLRREVEDLGRARTADENHALGLAYFGMGVACPFLEDENCSIYEERPLACREYLVISPAEHCSRPTEEMIKQLRLPFKTTAAFARLDADETRAQKARWVLLALALEWAEAHPEESAPLPGPEWVQRLLQDLTGKEVGQAPKA